MKTISALASTRLTRSRAGFALALAAALLVSGCSTYPTNSKDDFAAFEARRAVLTPLDSWTANGRLALTTQTSAITASVRWRQEAERAELDLTGPLGQGSAKVVSSPEGAVVMTGKGDRFEAPSAESLIADELGYTVPVRGLEHWLVGRPAPGTVENFRMDTHGRLERLKQDGWDVQFLMYRTVGAVDLPVQLVLARDDLRGKIVVRDWAVGG